MRALFIFKIRVLSFFFVFLKLALKFAFCFSIRNAERRYSSMEDLQCVVKTNFETILSLFPCAFILLCPYMN